MGKPKEIIITEHELEEMVQMIDDNTENDEDFCRAFTELIFTRIGWNYFSDRALALKRLYELVNNDYNSEGFNKLQNFLYNGNQLFLVEADEYDRSFLNLNPNYACITSVDPDHLDIYNDFSGLEKGFISFINNMLQKLALESKWRP